MVTRRNTNRGYPQAHRMGIAPTRRVTAAPRIARTTTEDLTVDSPLKDEVNEGVTTPTDMGIVAPHQEDDPGTALHNNAVENWADQVGS